MAFEQWLWLRASTLCCHSCYNIVLTMVMSEIIIVHDDDADDDDADDDDALFMPGTRSRPFMGSLSHQTISCQCAQNEEVDASSVWV